MGRYLEEEIDLSGDLEVVRGLRRMPDLRLVIEDTYQNFQVSEDQGVSWKAESNPWLEKKRNSTYFLDAKMAPDGTLAVIYDDYPEGEGENQGEEDEEDVPEGMRLRRIAPGMRHWMRRSRQLRDLPNPWEQGKRKPKNLCFSFLRNAP